MEKLILELQDISDRSFEMARTALERPEARGEMAEESEELRKRLRAIRGDLEAQDPEALESALDLISESMLDLTYAATPAQGISLRLNREIRRRSRS